MATARRMAASGASCVVMALQGAVFTMSLTIKGLFTEPIANSHAAGFGKERDDALDALGVGSRHRTARRTLERLAPISSREGVVGS